VARAQQASLPIVAFLNSALRVDGGLLQGGLKEAGYAEGQKVTTEYRWTDNQYEPLQRI